MSGSKPVFGRTALGAQGARAETVLTSYRLQAQSLIRNQQQEMTENKNWSELASEYASQKAPRIEPQLQYLYGMAGFLGAWASITMFSLFAGINPDDYGYALHITMIVGFAVPVLFAFWRNHANSKYFIEEYKRIQAEHAAKEAKRQ